MTKFVSVFDIVPMQMETKGKEEEEEERLSDMITNKRLDGVRREIKGNRRTTLRKVNG